MRQLTKDQIELTNVIEAACIRGDLVVLKRRNSSENIGMTPAMTLAVCLSEMAVLHEKLKE